MVYFDNHDSLVTLYNSSSDLITYVTIVNLCMLLPHYISLYKTESDTTFFTYDWVHITNDLHSSVMGKRSWQFNALIPYFHINDKGHVLDSS